MQILDKMYFTIDLRTEKKDSSGVIEELSTSIKQVEGLLWNEAKERLKSVLDIKPEYTTSLVSYLRIIERSVIVDDFYKARKQMV